MSINLNASGLLTDHIIQVIGENLLYHPRDVGKVQYHSIWGRDFSSKQWWKTYHIIQVMREKFHTESLFLLHITKHQQRGKHKGLKNLQ